MCFKKICTKINIPDYRRFRWFFWILVSSLLTLLIFYLEKEKFFYKTAIDGTDYIYRSLWVLPFTFMGFSFLAFAIAKGGGSKDAPWSSYIFDYFPRLITFSLIIFSVSHFFEVTSGYIYYFLSAGLGLYLGYRPDVKLEDIWKRNV